MCVYEGDSANCREHWEMRERDKREIRWVYCTHVLTMRVIGADAGHAQRTRLDPPPPHFVCVIVVVSPLRCCNSPWPSSPVFPTLVCMAPSLPSPSPPSPSPSPSTPSFSYAAASKALRRTSATASAQLALCDALLCRALYPPPHALILHHLHHISTNAPAFPAPHAAASYFLAYWTLLARLLTPAPTPHVLALLPSLSPDFLALAAAQLRQVPGAVRDGSAHGDGVDVRVLCNATLAVLRHTPPPTPALFANLLDAISTGSVANEAHIHPLFAHLLPLIPSIFPTAHLLSHTQPFAVVLAAVVRSQQAHQARRYVAPLLLQQPDNQNRHDPLVAVLDALVATNVGHTHMPEVFQFIITSAVVHAQNRRVHDHAAALRTPVQVLNCVVSTSIKYLAFPQSSHDNDAKSHAENVDMYVSRVRALTRLFHVAARMAIIDHSLVKSVQQQRLSKKPRLHNATPAHPLFSLVHNLLQTATSLRSQNTPGAKVHTVRQALAEAVAALCSYSIEPSSQFLSLLFEAFQPPRNAPARLVLASHLRAFAEARRLPELLRAFAAPHPAPYEPVCADTRVTRVIAAAVFRMHRAVVQECIDALIQALVKPPSEPMREHRAGCLTAVLAVVLESFGPQGPSQMPSGVQTFVDALISKGEMKKKKKKAGAARDLLRILKALLIIAASGAVLVEERFETCCAQLVAFLGDADCAQDAASADPLHAALWTKLRAFKPSTEVEAGLFVQLLATLVLFYTRRLKCFEVYDARFVRDVCHVAFEQYQTIRGKLVESKEEDVSYGRVSFEDLVPPLSVLCHAYDSVGVVVDKVSPHVELFLQDAARAFVLHGDENEGCRGVTLWEHLVELAFVRDFLHSNLEHLLFQPSPGKHSVCKERRLNDNVFSLIVFLASRVRRGDPFSEKLVALVAHGKSTKSYCGSRGQELVSEIERQLTSHNTDFTGFTELLGGKKKKKSDHRDETSGAYAVIASIVADLSGVNTGYLRTDASTAGNSTAPRKRMPNVVGGDVSSSQKTSYQIEDVLQLLEPMVSRPGNETEEMKTNSSPLSNQLTQQQIMLLSRIQQELISRSGQIPNSTDVENVFMIACVRVCQRLISKRGHVTRWPVAQLLCNIVRRAARLGSVSVAIAVNNMMNTLSRMLKREQVTAELCCSILGNFCHAVSQCAEPAFRRSIEMGMAVVMNEMSPSSRTRLLTELDEKSADVLRQVHEICLSKVQYYGR